MVIRLKVQCPCCRAIYRTRRVHPIRCARCGCHFTYGKWKNRLKVVE